ncbi:hypothetical protein [Prauserella flavalba]|uniref:hypothetical protein n=1 Tax=Prauserella flavalba TaxID=1477506 RepID=UPI0036EE264E
MPAKDLVFTVLGIDRASGTFTKVGDSIDRLGSRANKSMAAVTAGSAAAALGVGAAVAGVPALFIGLGAVALRENAKVKSSFQDLSREVQSGLTADAAPLESAYVGAADRMGTAYQRLRPQMQDAFAASVPLVASLTDGVTGFAEGAMPGMVRSVQRAGPVMEGFGSLLEDTGAGLGGFFDEVSQHSEQAGQGLEHWGELVRGVLPEAGSIFGDLTDVWAERGGQVVDVITQLMGVLSSLSGSTLPTLSATAGVALDVLEGILGVIEPMTPILGPAIGAWLALAAAMKGIRAAGGVITSVVGKVGELTKSTDTVSRGTKLMRAGLLGAAAAAGTALSQMDQLNPQVDALATGLEKWADGGKMGGEAARILGGDLEQLRGAFDTVTAGGLAGFAEGTTDVVAGLIGMDSGLDVAKERITALDGALAQMAKQSPEQARQAFNQLTTELGLSGAQISELQALMPGYTGALEQAAGAATTNADATRASKAELEAYVQKLREATDPVFALISATRAVDEAQTAYNDAINEYGANSPQARDAAVALGEAVAAAEAAARDGSLSYQDFEAKLRQWVGQGAITAAQADAIRDRVNGARGAADRFAKTYTANVRVVDRASSKVREVQRVIDSLTGKTVYIRTVYEAVNGGRGSYSTRFGSRGASGQAALKDGGVVRGYAGGGAFQMFPIGFLQGPGGPRTDSILARVSKGEFVSTAASTAENRPALEAGNRGAKLVAVAGSFADGGMVGAAQEVLARLQRGATVFEDFSYRGMSGNLGRYNDRLADAFYRSHRGFDFGGAGTRETLIRFLRQMTTAAAPAQRQERQDTGNVRAGSADELFLAWLRKAIKTRGGNVQLVLGG